MAMSRYKWKRQNPTQRQQKVPRVPSGLRDFDNRFSVLLLNSINEKMKTRVLEESQVDMTVDVSSIYILDTIWEDVAPG
eukprot:8440693-Prorocentrum_lima.AAC.1